jgi:hypothetical protein
MELYETIIRAEICCETIKNIFLCVTVTNPYIFVCKGHKQDATLEEKWRFLANALSEQFTILKNK